MLGLLVLSIASACTSTTHSGFDAHRPPARFDQVPIEAFSNVVLPSDLAVDDLAGTMGIVNPAGKPYGEATTAPGPAGALGLALSWRFGVAADDYTGWFFNLGPSSKDQ